MTIHRVYLSTSHFTFEAFGENAGDAIAAFRRGWEVHAKATGAARFESEEFAQQLFPDLQFHEIETGAFYRDMQPDPLYKAGRKEYAVVHSGTYSGVARRAVVKTFKSKDAAERFAEKKNGKTESGYYIVEEKN